jgi:xanthine/uracil/vitamin C permease (AzgA family)
VIFYTLTKIATGKFREISVVVWVLTILFVLRYVYLAAAA